MSTLNFSGSPTIAGRDKSVTCCEVKEGSVFARVKSGDQAIGLTRSPAAARIQQTEETSTPYSFVSSVLGPVQRLDIATQRINHHSY